MSYSDEYKRWLDSDYVDSETKAELLKIENDETEKEFRFYSPLAFGTAGLRGKMCAGINAINTYTVKQATQGIATLINTVQDGGMRGVAIAYDCRHNSRLFAECAASVLAANDIEVFLFDDMRPTPLLSFAIRYLGCIAGINITASHNTKEYNGFKAYWDDGAQIPPEHAKTVAEYIKNTDIFTGVKQMSYEDAKKSGFVHMIAPEVDRAYLNAVLSGQVNPGIVRDMGKDFKIVYSPMHGVGYKLVPEALDMMGIKNVFVVPEQGAPNGDFPSVKSPNPEYPEAHALGVKLANEVGADVFIATDPDSDRLGVSARSKNGFSMLSGNQIGALLLEYIIQSLKEKSALPCDAYAVKTIVSSELVTEICRANNIKLYNVFTGFKFIGEKIKECENAKNGTFIFGYEESIGYMRGAYVRDKDGVCAAVMVAEMAAYYASKGKTLHDALDDLYEKYGVYFEKTDNIYMEGLDGIEKMKALMEKLRKTPPKTIGNFKVAFFRDYEAQTITDMATGKVLPTGMQKSNVLYFEMENGDRVIIRPSGTEPKIKIYCLQSAATTAEAETNFEAYQKTTSSWR